MPQPKLDRKVKVTLLGLVLNAFLSAVKIAAGLLGHSQALVADGVESLADLISSLVVWRGVTLAELPADESHPYGHGKAEPLAAAVVSSVLIFASLWIASAAVRDILRPHETPASFTLLVLIGVVITKEILFRFVRRQGLTLESSALTADAWHHRSDAITSTFAFIGISIALWGGPGYEAADDCAALLAAGIIAWNGWRLLRPAMDELMDRSPHTAFTERVTAIAATIPEVALVEKCLVRKMGNDYFVDMHIEVDPAMTVLRAHDVAHQVKAAVQSQIPSVRDVLVHIEPAGRKRGS